MVFAVEEPLAPALGIHGVDEIHDRLGRMKALPDQICVRAQSAVLTSFLPPASQWSPQEERREWM